MWYASEFRPTPRSRPALDPARVTGSRAANPSFAIEIPSDHVVRPQGPVKSVRVSETRTAS